MSMLTGPPRDTAISFSAGRRSSISPVIGARWLTRISAPSTKRTISSGSPMILLQARQAAIGIAVAHRLVRPRQLQGADIDIEARHRGERVGEGRSLHELVADHRDLERVHQCILLAREVGPDRRHRLARFHIDREELVVAGSAARPAGPCRAGKASPICRPPLPCRGARRGDRRHHGSAGRTGLLACAFAHRHAQRAREEQLSALERAAPPAMRISSGCDPMAA